MSVRAPTLESLLSSAIEARDKPAAFVLAGHNGSGKSTLWHEKLVSALQMPLINADRLMGSILPVSETGQLPPWAQRLRDDDVRWQELSQHGVRALKDLVAEQRIPFAFETVFSYWMQRPDGTHASKAEDIIRLQRAGYYVVLLFVGLTSALLSAARVETRRQQGGHAVPHNKLLDRFPRTQAAIGHAAPIADMTLFFDNSRDFTTAFSLVRVQRKALVLYDCRDPKYKPDQQLLAVAERWLPHIVGPFPGAT